MVPLALVLLVGVPDASSMTYYYGFDKDADTFWGTDGWEGSFCDDPWATNLNGGVTPLTDSGCDVEGCSAGNHCGYEFGYYSNCSHSDPFDNHVQVGALDWKDYVFTARFRNSDDDTVGFVFRYTNSANFYLFFMSRDIAPNPALPCSESFVGSRLLRIRDSKVKVLGTSEVTYVQGAVHKVRIELNGSQLKVQIDADLDGTISPQETVFDVQDGKLPTGKVGLFAYENGAAGSAACSSGECWFDDVQVDVYTLGDDPCQGISYEGACVGNDLYFCIGGNLYKQTCGGGCCMWVPPIGLSACVAGNVCQAGCVQECELGMAGCSIHQTHSYSCQQADGDPCNEMVFEACTDTGVCDSTTGQCMSVSCTSQCEGKECGSDSCGGSCGQCPGNSVCEGGECGCLPDCVGKECGSDGCGGDCGTCQGSQTCTNGKCGCVPECGGKNCGSDGCGGLCGPCGEEHYCDAGTCKPGHCDAQCDGMACGYDGCGGLCGSCLSWCSTPSDPQDKLPYEKLELCVDGGCLPECCPECWGKECGPDGCGGSCGTCELGDICLAGQCNECKPSCLGMECGDDGCHGLCGECPAGFYCSEWRCEEGECEAECEGLECGYDGCGGLCGNCRDGAFCVEGLCKTPGPASDVLTSGDALYGGDSDVLTPPVLLNSGRKSAGCTAGSTASPEVAFLLLLLLALIVPARTRD